MRKTVMILASAAALLALPAVAQQGAGVATGAASGAVVGGVVGGPVGAAVGAGVGATVGAAGESANRPKTVVVDPGPTGTVRERTTTCVQGAGTQTCSETEVRR
jgi:hypothetical protein